MSADVKITETPRGSKPVELGTKAFWAKCADCLHCWPAAYFPMDAAKFAKIIGRKPRCPKCASANVVVAKQANGALLEPPTE